VELPEMQKKFVLCATALTVCYVLGAAVSAVADSPYGDSAPDVSVPAAQAEPAPAPLAEPPAKPGRYVPPITRPFYNEAPEITTELRPVYIYHRIPEGFLSDGGDVHIVALQLRAAITDRLAFIATKDGWADIDFDKNLRDDRGFFNVAAGFKYAFFSDPATDTYMTAGIRYEAPVGSLKTGNIKLQGGGDGMIDVFLTGTRPIGTKAAIQGSFGYNGAIDSDHDSSFVHAMIHGNYEIVKNLYGIMELSMIAVADHGDRLDVGSFEGEDAFNFGNSESDTVFPLAFGARYRFTDNLIVGAAYEFPIDHKDITKDRVTVDAVIHF
jgi:opacity protein-like surface antigen